MSSGKFIDLLASLHPLECRVLSVFKKTGVNDNGFKGLCQEKEDF